MTKRTKIAIAIIAGATPFLIFAVTVVVVLLVNARNDRQGDATDATNPFGVEGTTAAELKLKQLETGEIDSDEFKEVSEKTMQAMERTRQQATGDEKLALDVLVPVVNELRKLNEPFAASIQQFLQMNGLDLASVDSRDNLKSRIELMETLGQQNAAILQYMRQMPADIEQRCLAAGIAPQTAGMMVENFMAGGNFLITTKLREQDAVMFESGMKMLNVADEHWGAWEFNEETEMVEFESTEANKAYDQARQKMTAAAEEQQLTQQKMAEQIRAQQQMREQKSR